MRKLTTTIVTLILFSLSNQASASLVAGINEELAHKSMFQRCVDSKRLQSSVAAHNVNRAHLRLKKRTMQASVCAEVVSKAAAEAVTKVEYEAILKEVSTIQRLKFAEECNKNELAIAALLAEFKSVLSSEQDFNALHEHARTSYFNYYEHRLTMSAACAASKLDF